MSFHSSLSGHSFHSFIHSPCLEIWWKLCGSKKHLWYLNSVIYLNKGKHKFFCDGKVWGESERERRHQREQQQQEDFINFFIAFYAQICCWTIRTKTVMISKHTMNEWVDERMTLREGKKINKLCKFSWGIFPRTLTQNNFFSLALTQHLCICGFSSICKWNDSNFTLVSNFIVPIFPHFFHSLNLSIPIAVLFLRLDNWIEMKFTSSSLGIFKIANGPDSSHLTCIKWCKCTHLSNW